MLIRNYMHKSKSQMASMFLILLVAAALMSIGALTLLDFRNFLDEKAEQLNAPHVIAIVDKGSYSPAHLDYLRSDLSVTLAGSEDIMFIPSCSFLYGDGKNMQSVVIQNADTVREMSPMAMIGETAGLTSDSLYAPYMLRVGGGYQAGDSITLEYGDQEYTYHIAGFVEDIMLGANNMGIMGFYMPEPLFKRTMAEGKAEPAVLLSAQLSDPGLSEEVSKGFQVYCNEGRGAIYGFSITVLKMARLLMVNMVSMIMVAFAVIITITALIVIHFRISDSIRDDMKDIGILKAMGYTNRQIKASVLMQFLGVTFIAGIAGIGASYLLIPSVSLMFSSQSGLVWDQGFAPQTSILCLAAMLAAVFLNVLGSLRQVKELHPIMAIRGETKGEGAKKNYFRLDRDGAGLQFSLAGKLLMENKKQNFIIALVIASITFASAFGLVLYYNMAVDSELFIETVGGVMCSVVLSPRENINAGKLLEEIGAMPGVDKAFFFDSRVTLIDDEEFFTDIMQDFEALEGQMLYEGSYPGSAGEAAIGGHAAEDFGKKIGDTVRVSHEDEEAEYVISGFIQSGNYMGRQLFLTEEGMVTLMPDFQPSVIYVYLEKGEAADIFIALLKSQYGGAIREPVNFDEILEGQIRSYVTLTALLALIVLLITGVIVFLILYFVIKTMISRRRRRFGVQKALGYTTYQIMQQIAMSFSPIVLAGSLLGAAMGCVGINPLVTALFRSVGIMKFDMVISYTWLGLLCVGLVLLSYAIAMVISFRIRGISAYILVTE